MIRSQLRYIAIAALLIAVHAPLHGADGDFAFSADAYHFHGPSGPEVEVTIRIPVTELTFDREGDEAFLARYTPSLDLVDVDGQVVRSIAGERVATRHRRRETQDPDGAVDDIARFGVEPGSYEAVLTVKSAGRQGTVRLPVDVPPRRPGALSISGLQFIRSIDPVSPIDRPERFRKAGRVLLPAPGRTVSPQAPVRWYFELYEIGRLPHEIRYQVIDRFGHAVASDTRSFGPYRDEAQFVTGLPLRDIPPGPYTLRVEAEAGDQRVRVERRFSVAGEAVAPPGHFTTDRQEHLRRLIAAEDPDQAAAYEALGSRDRALFAYGYWLEAEPWLAEAYVGPVTGLGRHVLRLPMLKALKNENTLKKRVDRTFAERLSEPDTARVRRAREQLDVVLDVDKEEPFALVGDALVALNAGQLAEGEVYARKALEMMPDLSDAENAIGLSKIGRRDWDAAARRFAAASRMAPAWNAPRVNAELVRFLRGQGDEEAELGHVRKAVLFDLTHPDLYYVAGRLLERHDRLDESVTAYVRQVDVNPLHGRAQFDLGRVLYKQGRVDSAAAVWRDLMNSRPDFRDVCVSPLLDAYIRNGETGKAQALISEELRRLDPETRARVEDISLVAGPEELAAYRSLPEEERSRFIRAFWQKRDPTPATPGNERLVEHYRRVVHALHNFPAAPGEWGWDRRGDVYIRYGEPAHVSKHNDIRFETDPMVIRVRERLMRTLTPEEREEIIARAGRQRTSTRDRDIQGPNGERVAIHDFESIDFEMNPNRVFYVSESDDVNRYVRGTEEVSYRGRTRENPIHGLPLFPVDGGTPWEYWVYPDVAGGIEVVFTALGGSYDFPEVPRGRKLARFNQKAWNERRSEVVVKRATSAQPDLYRPPKEAIDFHFATADFRGVEGRSRLEVYYGVPVTAFEDAASGTVFERGIALFDTAWTPIYRNTVPVAVDAGRDSVDAGTLAIDEVALALRPGRYYLGVQVTDPATHRWNGYTQEVAVEDYGGDGLAVSDIEIAGRVEPDSAATVKAGLRVVPMPSKTFKVGQPVLIYYEIYGLARDSFGQTKHRVDYRIKPRTGKLSAVKILRAVGRLLGIEEKAIVTISYERTGSESDEQTYLEIDPGESKEGVYELTVTVTDLISEASAEKSTTFLIGE